MHTDRCSNTNGQKFNSNGSRKEIKHRGLRRESTKVEQEIYYDTGNNWRYRNTNKRFKVKFGNHTRKNLNRFATKGSCTFNITHNTVK